MSGQARQSSADIEAATARLLGASPEDADAAVQALAAHAVLTDGVLLHAVLAAARGGSGLPEALAALSRLQAPPATWSAYEARTAAEEAAEEAVAALTALRPDIAREAVVHGVREAADALRDGAGRLRITGPLDVVERDWLQQLCDAVGARIDDANKIVTQRAQGVFTCSPDALDLVVLAKKSG